MLPNAKQFSSHLANLQLRCKRCNQCDKMIWLKLWQRSFKVFAKLLDQNLAHYTKKVAKVAQSFCQKVNQLYKNLPNRKKSPKRQNFCHIWPHWILCKQHLLSFLLPYLIWLGSFNGSSWRSLRPPPPWSSQPFAPFSAFFLPLLFLWPFFELDFGLIYGSRLKNRGRERKKDKEQCEKNCWRAFLKYFYNCH